MPGLQRRPGAGGLPHPGLRSGPGAGSRSRWLKVRRALRREDQAHLDRLFELARLHLQAGVYTASPWPLESMLLSMLLEHQKALGSLAERLRKLEQLLRGGSTAATRSAHAR